jgi:hypothetical protein
MGSNVPSSAIELAGFVLFHCAVIADLNRNGELICPFVVLSDESGRRSIEFESETQEEAIEKGWASLDHSIEKSESWAFGREGLLRIEDSVSDVLLVSIWEPGMTSTLKIRQRFSRGQENELYLVGSPELLLAVDDGSFLIDTWDQVALMRGIMLHPKSHKWSEFQKLPD